MSKVDWITWKTDTKEIINPKKIEEEISEYYENYNSYITPMVYEQLKNEINRGGLTKDAFNVSGISPANEMAIEIINAIDEIKQTMKVLQENVIDIAKDQKEIEKGQLILEIENKLKQEQMLLKSIESSNEVKNNITKIGSNPDDIIYIIKDRINKLRERLDQAQSL